MRSAGNAEADEAEGRLNQDRRANLNADDATFSTMWRVIIRNGLQPIATAASMNCRLRTPIVEPRTIRVEAGVSTRPMAIEIVQNEAWYIETRKIRNTMPG